MITLEHVYLQRGAKQLLVDASAVVHPGQKVALVGANGTGKSSLFDVILGNLSVDSGNLGYPKQWRIAHMAQEVAHVERMALDFVLDGDAAVRKVEAAIAKAEAQQDDLALANLHQQLDDMGGYTAAIRAQKLLQGLGFSTDDNTRSVNSFSGGWRIRLNLAQALMCPSDLLLLDEPTNHLDLDASLWLESWLQQYAGTILLISHDRDFIDRLCQHTLHIEKQTLTSYRGNYSAFERQRAERLAQNQANYEKQQRRIADIQDFVRRFRAKATKARQAQSRLKELERMEVLAPAHIDSPFDFHFPVPERFSDPLLSLQHCVLGYDNEVVLENVNLNLHPGSRIGLLGANGAGKSTLLKNLAGVLQPLKGNKARGEHLHIGYFSQHQLEALDIDASPLLHLQRLTPQATEQSMRNFLGGFNFIGEMALEPITLFSGGEKARLALAIIVWQKPNLLLLDEPTNHLDLDMCHALTVALQEFQGSVVLVSHDRHLIRNTVDELVLVANGKALPFDGNLDDYSRWLLAETRNRQSSGSAEKSAAQQTDRKQQRQRAAEIRKQLSPSKNAVKKIETAMEKNQLQLNDLEKLLADSNLYQPQQRDSLNALLKEQGQIKNQQDKLEADWCDFQQQLENMQAELDRG